MKKILFQILLIFLIAVLLTACGNDKDIGSPTETVDQTEPGVEEKVTYLVKVQNKAGAGIEDVDVRVYADATLDDLIAVGKTGEDGCFSFDRVKAEGYVAVLSDQPTGHAVEEQYPLTGEETLVVLGIGTMTDADMDAVCYELGDAMLDFTVTGPEGAYTLSELLTHKKAVILNFWYEGCDPCKGEFPHLQEAYEAYSDQIELLAMDPVDGDDLVAAFKTSKGYTFPMLSVDGRWQDMFQIRAYPLTVVIDRYGNICLMHNGAFSDAETIEKMLAYFTADDYEQRFFRSIAQIP